MSICSVSGALKNQYPRFVACLLLAFHLVAEKRWNIYETEMQFTYDMALL